jgi:hypothetical protein
LALFAGFGFVEFETAEGAAEAINSRDRQMFHGHRLTVSMLPRAHGFVLSAQTLYGFKLAPTSNAQIFVE